MTLYILLDGCNCMKQDENMQQLWELWKILKDKEQEMQERINEYKKIFINE